MPALRRLILPLACLMAGLAPGMAGTVDTAECRRDLIVLDTELSEAQARLVKAQVLDFQSAIDQICKGR